MPSDLAIQQLSMYNTIWKIEIMHIHIQKKLPCITRLGTDILNADNMGTDNAASTDSIPYKKIQAGKTNSLFFLSFSSDCFRKSMSTHRPQKEHREAAKTKDR